MATTDIEVVIGARIDKLAQAVEQSKQMLGSIQGSVDSLKSGFTSLGRLIGITFTVGGLASFVENMADLGVAANRTYAQIGGTSQQIMQLKAMASLAGADFESLVTSVSRVSLSLQRSTADAFSPAAQGLKALGLSAKDLIGLHPADMILKFGEALSKFEPGLNRTNAAMAAGGRAMLQLLPVADLGRDRLAAFMAEYQKLGAGVDIRKFADTKAELILLERSFDRVGKIIFDTFQPAINFAIRTVREFVGSISANDIQAGLQAVFEGLKVATAGVIAFFVTAKRAFEDVFGFLGKVGSAFGVVGNLFSFAGDQLAGIRDNLRKIQGLPLEDRKGAEEAGRTNVQEYIRGVMNEFDRYRDLISSKLSLTGSGGAAEPRQQAPAINEAERKNIQATQTRLQGQIALEQGYLEQKKALYDIDAQMGIITEQTKLERVKAATLKEFELERDKLQRIRDLWPAHTQEWEAANQAMLQASQRFNLENIRIQGEMLRDIKSKWDELFGALQSSINGSLRGLIQGTTTFKEAFRSLVLDMLMFFIQAIEKMVFNWIAGQIAMAMAPGATAAKAAAFTSDITADAARAYGGVFAFLAPLMGPAAAGPALAAEASVMAQMAAIPKFAVGSWSVPRDMLAMIHEGERIVPKGVQGGGWDEGRGGGASVQVNISAVDARSVAAWAREHAGSLAAAVTGHQARNPSARGAF